eukprot:1721824-Rhodomonas_salina.1
MIQITGVGRVKRVKIGSDGERDGHTGFEERSGMRQWEGWVDGSHPTRSDMPPQAWRQVISRV